MRPSRRAISRYRETCHHIHVMIFQIPPKGPHHIRRVVGNGKDPSSPFDLGLDPVTPEKGEEIFPEEAAKGAVEKAAVRAVHGDEIVEIPGVRQVAAAFSADQDLLSRTVGLFQEKDFGASLRGPSGGHQSTRARADDDHAVGLIAMVQHNVHRPTP